VAGLPAKSLPREVRKVEVRASYLLVGSVVLALLTALAVFAAWLVRVDVDQEMRIYEIAFEGSVTGLQEGAQVQYRGVPVGRVDEIRINPENLTQVLVTVGLEPDTPIKEDTLATLEMQGVTGVAYVQLRAGSLQSAPLEPGPDGRPPRIPSRPSVLERVFESTPELLAQGLMLIERVSQLFQGKNVEAFTETLQNLEGFSDALAQQSDSVAMLVEDAGGAARQVEEASGELVALTRDLRELTSKLDRQVDKVGGELVGTLGELRTAATAFGGSAGKLDGMIGDIRQPLNDFAGSGLYELTQLVGETRVLVAALNRITKEFERDPTGFLLGNSQGGFQAE
jgi:phospholipid/cholesterol/gamma-HCH transport system substrate-binding protein